MFLVIDFKLEHEIKLYEAVSRDEVCKQSK